MTAEIAILNKLAVTLAADSAVTLQVGGNEKIYNSADKIFEVSTADPIALMVYNSLEISGVPIEVLAKEYRDKKCNSNFLTVLEFSENFLKYIEGVSAPKDTIDENIFWSVVPELREAKRIYTEVMNSEILRIVEDESRAEELLSTVGLRVASAIEDRLLYISSQSILPWAGSLNSEDVLRSHENIIDSSIEHVFNGTKIIDDVLPILRKIAAETLLRGLGSDRVTGLVFAGFGQSETFPTLVSYEVYGLVAGRLKYRKHLEVDIDRSTGSVAEIIPFAQQDVAERFIYGFDGFSLELIDSYFDKSLHRFCEMLSSFLEKRDGELGRVLPPVLNEASSKIMEEFREKVMPEQLRRSKQQIADMVRFMPKQELAAMAESLVNITSLKRRFSAEAESVGGPIDVVMITRSEGVVWVKRKHYFDPALNPRYFYRRYGVGKPTVAGKEA